MFPRKLVAIVAIAIASLAPSIAAAAEPSATELPAGAPCILRDHHITAVVPYRVDERVVKGTVRRLRGAEVSVEARPGLTAEWLRHELGRHRVAMRGSGSMADCAFDVDDVRVEVESAGAGFTVRLIASDTAKGEAVLRRARLLLG